MKEFLLKLRKYITVGFLIIVSSIIFVLVADFAIGRMMHKRKEVQVPDLKGQDLVISMKILKKKKLVLKIEGERFERKVAPGVIVSQIPAADTVVRQRKVIRVVISKGGEQIEVPDIIEKEVRLGEIALRNKALLVGQEKFMYSNYIDEGYIMRQDPAPKTIVGKGYFVNLAISKGQPPEGVKLLPKFIGRSLEQIKETIPKRGYSIFVVEKADEEISEPGIVLDQNPEPDTVIKKRRIELTLVVSKEIEELDKQEKKELAK